MCLRLKQSNLVWLQVDVAIQTDSARVAATKAYHNYEVAFEFFHLLLQIVQDNFSNP